MHKASCHLPKKPSALIRLAIDDLKQAEKSDEYRINMNDWHDGALTERYNPDTCQREVGSPCEVCLAGSVMAFSLNLPPTHRAFPDNWGDEIAGRLEAINGFRIGQVYEALVAMRHPKADKISKKVPDREIVDYRNDPAVFKRQMLRLAQELEKAGA